MEFTIPLRTDKSIIYAIRRKNYRLLYSLQMYFISNEDGNNIYARRVNESNPPSKVWIRLDDRSRAKPYRVKWIETWGIRKLRRVSHASILYQRRESALVERVVRSRFSSMERSVSELDQDALVGAPETWRPPTSRRSNNASADIDVHPFEVRTRRVVALPSSFVEFR